MVRDSVSALKPVNNLSATSERGGASERNFPADLMMLSKIDEARSSDVALKPVKTLSRASDIAGDSASDLKPVNNLSTTSERGGASERNFPAFLLMLSKIDEARSSDVALKPVKTLESASDIAGDSVSALKPVNNLSATSERGEVSERNFEASFVMLTMIDEARFSEVALKPVKTLKSKSARTGSRGNALKPKNQLS